MRLPDSATLGEARRWLRARAAKGAPCPCCKQLTKIYRRRLDSGNARALILLVALFTRTGGWIPVHRIVQELGTSGIDLAKVARWGLIEAKPNPDDPTKRASGWWRPTQLGIDFAHGRITVPRWAEIYNGRTLRLDDSERTDIRQALGKRFDYAELMAGVASSAPHFDGGDTPP